MPYNFRKAAQRAALIRTLGNPILKRAGIATNFRGWLRGDAPTATRKVVHVYQSAPNDCAAACLSMIARAHGLDVSLSDLAPVLGPMTRGVGLSQFVKAAEILGLVARPVRVGLHRLADLRLPTVLHWDMNHFVVLTRVGNDWLDIADPGKGMLRIPIEDAEERFTGVAVEFRLQEGWEEHHSKGLASRRLPTSLFAIDWGLTKIATRTVSIIFIFQLVLLAQPFFLRELSIAIDSWPQGSAIALLIGLGMLMVFHFTANVARAHALDVAGRGVAERFSLRAMRIILKLPPEYINVRSDSAVAQQVQSLETMRKMLVDEFLPGAVDLAVLVFASILLYVFNPIAAAIVTSSILFDFFIRASGFSSEKISAAKLIDARLQQSAYLQEAVRGFQSIKLAGGEATRFAQWESRVIELADIESKIAHERAIRNSLSSILLPIEFSCLIFFTSTNAVTATGVAALFGIFAFRSIIKERALSVTNLVPSFFSFREMLGRIDHIRYARPDRGGESPSISGNHMAIEFKNVSFSYDTHSPPVISSLNLTISPGEFVVISGPSGCGKSSLLRLLLGVATPTSGEINFGEQSILDCDLSSWRSNIAAVLQEDILFSGSVAENIALFDGFIDLEKIRKAAAEANIDDDIQSLPMGYLTHLAEGENILSAGQRQRILLARAFYRQCPIVVFDEGTSHLDTECERLVADSLSKLDATRIIVAHRSILMDYADRVLELRDGSIVDITEEKTEFKKKRRHSNCV